MSGKASFDNASGDQGDRSTVPPQITHPDETAPERKRKQPRSDDEIPLSTWFTILLVLDHQRNRRGVAEAKAVLKRRGYTVRIRKPGSDRPAKAHPSGKGARA